MLSIFSQYGNETKGCLSYCLPSIYSRKGIYSLLQFEDDASIGGRLGAKVQMTKLVPNVTSHAVTVMGISINGKRLSVDLGVFRMRPNHTGGFVFDTRCPLTVLDRRAYTVVKD